MLKVIANLRHTAILAVLTLALVATGFAHRIPTVQDAFLQSYVLAGGSLADLCADIDGDGLADHGDCPACHIVASADLPDPGPVSYTHLDVYKRQMIARAMQRSRAAKVRLARLSDE